MFPAPQRDCSTPIAAAHYQEVVSAHIRYKSIYQAVFARFSPAHPESSLLSRAKFHPKIHPGKMKKAGCVRHEVCLNVQTYKINIDLNLFCTLRFNFTNQKALIEQKRLHLLSSRSMNGVSLFTGLLRTLLPSDRIAIMIVFILYFFLSVI